MTPARDYLFALCDAGGNAPPMLGAVRRLVGRGHRVRVIADTSLAAGVAKAGAAFLPWTTAPNRPDQSVASDVMRDWEVADPMQRLARLRDRVMIGPAARYAADVTAALQAAPADVVVSSDLIFGPMIAAEATGLPWAVLSSNLCYLPIPGIPPFGPGLMPARSEVERRQAAEMQAGISDFLGVALPILNEARAGFGLRPLDNPLDQPASAHRFLAATCRDFDFPAESLPPALRYVGPILDEPEWIEDMVPNVVPEGPEPLVLVAFSTTFQDHIGVIQRVIDALDSLSARAVVTLGPALDGARLRAGERVAVVANASHDHLLRKADAVVTHAGHGTVMRALSNGVPLLCLPMGRDQHDNAIRVVAHGAGLQLDPSATSDTVRSALLRLLAEPSFRDSARRLGEAVNRSIRSSALVDALEECLPG
ncbi:glycosyltransferase [Methylobacterium brachythecii]|uniref:MGT family glycosyltransferase n=1 Tax=Methylobacterium brachythecii TaxID=1176177 RepID=A0A7W6AHT7_9HYPH|nr:glycosyltransferase [Methylobacterium brachythecii]MBB3903610.1 MGT family glycosyltransferase [Methylobacterium brachythecii]GLS46920.1 N-glycosyltransferase [Methylobacterium brachythecii]